MVPIREAPVYHHFGFILIGWLLGVLSVVLIANLDVTIIRSRFRDFRR
jgi:hypothetical protein